MAFLCISLDNSSVNGVHILDGELETIDKFTLRHNSAKSILKEFPEKIVELKERYNIDSEETDIKLRIFLSNDKEQPVLYHKHFITFKYVIKDRKFLRYAVSFDNGLFNKNLVEMIEDDSIPSNLVLSEVYNFIKGMDEFEYYKLIRSICDQYINYKEDYEDDDDILTVEQIYNNYIDNKQDSMANTQTSEFNPFAVFEHPNFFKIYGSSIKADRPIFILGAKSAEDAKSEYEEIVENTEKCFRNDIFSPLNASVSRPLDDDFKMIFDKSILLIVDANGFDEEIINKIKYASSKEITVLLLVTTDALKEQYEKLFVNNETVIVKKYIFKDFKSKKEFADIMVGLYINEYKKNKIG